MYLSMREDNNTEGINYRKAPGLRTHGRSPASTTDCQRKKLVKVELKEKAKRLSPERGYHLTLKKVNVTTHRYNWVSLKIKKS